MPIDHTFRLKTVVALSYNDTSLETVEVFLGKNSAQSEWPLFKFRNSWSQLTNQQNNEKSVKHPKSQTTEPLKLQKQ